MDVFANWVKASTINPISPKAGGSLTDGMQTEQPKT